jgi:hypothetical protein
MSRRPLRRQTKTIASLAVFILALIHANADAALPDSALLQPQQTTSEEQACQIGLKFGMTANHIPPECQAYPVMTRVTSTGRREKWQYRGGYLFFDNGLLMAIRQMKP